MKDKFDKNLPYAKRTRWRGSLPWFLINMGIAAKGKNCESVNAGHHWYNKDGKTSACYHCEIIKEGKHWQVLNETDIVKAKQSNSLYKNLKFIVENLIFEKPNDLVGKIIKIDTTSLTIEGDIQFEFNQISNFNTTLKKTENRRLAIKKYGFIDLEFKLNNLEGQLNKNPFQILKNEQVLQKNEFENSEEREEAREIMSLMLEDDIQSIKDGKLCLKIFAESIGGFTSQFDLFQKGENKKVVANPKNNKLVEFKITDACITNLPGIWFNKHFYW